MACGLGINSSIDLPRFGARGMFAGLQTHAAPDETRVLIGTCGFGGSTPIRSIVGVVCGFNADVRFDGQPAAKALLPGRGLQDSCHLSRASCAQNPSLVLSDVRPARISGPLAPVGLAAVAEKGLRQLSEGRRRRLGLGFALLVKQRHLLLNEPFVSHDRTVVRDQQTLAAERIDRQQATAVLVSHDTGDAVCLAHRVVLLAGCPVRIVADQALDADMGLRNQTTIPGDESRIEITMLEATS